MHTMIHQGTAHGSSLWRCPICGMRYLVQLVPVFRKSVLKPGDPRAVHTWGRTEVQG